MSGEPSLPHVGRRRRLAIAGRAPTGFEVVSPRVLNDGFGWLPDLWGGGITSARAGEKFGGMTISWSLGRGWKYEVEVEL